MVVVEEEEEEIYLPTLHSCFIAVTWIESVQLVVVHVRLFTEL